MRTRALVVSVLTAVVAFPVAGSTAAERKIVVAVEAPMSGVGRVDGLDQLRGVELAARQINAAGGVLGRRVLVIRADDRGEPRLALPTFRRVARARADAVIGPYNSSVAVINLPFYVRAGIVPVQMASTDATSGIGVNVQPKTRQIAPVEASFILRQWAPGSVAILAGASSFLAGQADLLEAALRRDGVVVTRYPVEPGKDDYGADVARALSTGPQVVYVSTKVAEGAKIAAALQASGSPAKCFMGFANQDPTFVAQAGVEVSRHCVFSGVPLPQATPTARDYVRDYRTAFRMEPAVWGAFTYDSARILFRAMREAGTTDYGPVLARLRSTTGFRGATGTISINRRTGDRTKVAVRVLSVNGRGAFVIAPGGERSFARPSGESSTTGGLPLR